jgi:hypothetical protein
VKAAPQPRGFPDRSIARERIIPIPAPARYGDHWIAVRGSIMIQR